MRTSVPLRRCGAVRLRLSKRFANLTGSERESQDCGRADTSGAHDAFEAGHDGADRRARRRRPEHGLLRPERQAARVAEDARARPGGDRGARLPPARARPRACERRLAHDRPVPSFAAVAASAGAADVRRRRHAGDERERLRAAPLHGRHRPGDDRAARRERTRRRRDPDGDAARTTRGSSASRPTATRSR